MEILNTLFYLPIYNALIFLYDVLGSDLGIAIVALTVIIKLLLLPMSKQQITSQKQMQELQPKIQELKEKNKGDREKIAKETMALYKEHKVNPAAGCLPLIVTIIFFFTLYRVIYNLSEVENFVVAKEKLYSFVIVEFDMINSLSLDFLHLEKPNVYLAVITAAAAYYQIHMMQKRSEDKKVKDTQKSAVSKVEKETDEAPDFATVLQKQMLVIIPIMTLVIGVMFPAALTIYWLTSTLFTIGQQWFLTRNA